MGDPDTRCGGRSVFARVAQPAVGDGKRGFHRLTAAILTRNYQLSEVLKKARVNPHFNCSACFQVYHPKTMSKLEQARHTFEKALTACSEDLQDILQYFPALPWLDFWLNPPPILFAYLGRRDCRFILNEAKVVPLTGFLCVYPWDTTPAGAKKLSRALNHPATLANLSFVSKSYGGGALKTEPRQLDQLEIPQTVLDEVGLTAVRQESQPMLFDKPQPKKPKLPGLKRKLTVR